MHDPDVLVVVVNNHEDRRAGVARVKGDKYVIPRSVAEARMKQQQAAGGLVRILHEVLPGRQTGKSKGPSPENKALGPAPENKTQQTSTRVWPADSATDVQRSTTHVATSAGAGADRGDTLAKMNAVELRQLAAGYGLQFRANASKSNLLKLIEGHRAELARQDKERALDADAVKGGAVPE